MELLSEANTDYRTHILEDVEVGTEDRTGIEETDQRCEKDRTEWEDIEDSEEEDMEYDYRSVKTFAIVDFTDKDGESYGKDVYSTSPSLGIVHELILMAKVHVETNGFVDKELIFMKNEKELERRIREKISNSQNLPRSHNVLLSTIIWELDYVKDLTELSERVKKSILAFFLALDGLIVEDETEPAQKRPKEIIDLTEVNCCLRCGRCV